jgi:hypothetical protein
MTQRLATTLPNELWHIIFKYAAQLYISGPSDVPGPSLTGLMQVCKAWEVCVHRVSASVDHDS